MKEKETGLKDYVLIISVSFFLIFATGFIRSYQIFRGSVRGAVKENGRSAYFLSELILEHQRAAIGIIQGYANRPLVIDAAKRNDFKTIGRHLKELKNSAPEIDMVFFADKEGTLRANYPEFQATHGKNFSSADWYRGVSKEWKPYVSTIFRRIIAEKDHAVAICCPVFDEKGNTLGIIATTQRVLFLGNVIQKVKVHQDIKITLLDQVGQVIFSDKIPYKGEIILYPYFGSLEEAVQKGERDIEIEEPSDGGRVNYLSVVPIAEMGWWLLAEKGKADIFKEDIRAFLPIGVISLLLCGIVIGVILYLVRKDNFLKEVRILSSRILTAHEEERRSIAAELHDSLGSSLAAVKFGLEHTLKEVGSSESLKNSLSQLQETIEETRRIQMVLRPPILDDLGVIAALNWLCRDFEKTYSHIRLGKQFGIEEKDIPEILRIVIFRISQEALNNISKHSRADRVSLSVVKNSSLIELTIMDNGGGFNLNEALSRESSTRGLGLSSMKERATFSGGFFHIESSPGKGTIIRVSWTLPQTSKPAANA